MSNINAISKSLVKRNNKESRLFNLNYGVRQDAMLSVRIFALSINHLLLLNTSQKGCHFGHICTNTFG